MYNRNEIYIRTQHTPIRPSHIQCYTLLYNKKIFQFISLLYYGPCKKNVLFFIFILLIYIANGFKDKTQTIINSI